MARPESDLSGATVAILGAGTAALSAAHELHRLKPGAITVIETHPPFAGLAGRLRREDLGLDGGPFEGTPERGSGSRLGDQRRRRRVLVNGRLFDFPPKVIDVLKSYGTWNAIGFGIDFFKAGLARKSKRDDSSNLDAYLRRRVGARLYEAYFRPLIAKLWNTDPSRLTWGTGTQWAKNFDWNAPGGSAAETTDPGVLGLGAAADRLAESLRGKAEIVTGATVLGFDMDSETRIQGVDLRLADGTERHVIADIIVSTLPLESLYEFMPTGEEEEEKPRFDLRMRSLRVLFLSIDEPFSGPAESVLIPADDTRVLRVSRAADSSGGTLLAAEIVCQEGDENWTINEEKLERIVLADLKRLGLVKSDGPAKARSAIRAKNIYPIYAHGWQKAFRRLTPRMDAIANLFQIGPAALYLYGDATHGVQMARRLGEYFAAGSSRHAWTDIVRSFSTFPQGD